MTSRNPSVSLNLKTSQEGLDPTGPVTVLDHTGVRRGGRAAVEHPLTIRIDGNELITLMTIGTHPECLVIGYLRNQGLIAEPQMIESVTVDWLHEVADVITRNGSGIQNVIAGELPNAVPVTPIRVRRSEIYAIVAEIPKWNAIYRLAGSVHGCGLFEKGELRYFYEDVGRHNATDALAGQMWIDGFEGDGTILYSTGRLTAEIVAKVASMRIPVLISRNGVTYRAVELARKLNVMLVARARNKKFDIYSCHDFLEVD
ncbi:MAG: formate dehydrogenase accessory protein [marine bacterium B5-7]|nr:MAG: formate dehydrogenase accessory protein [marine bacterium B5-7]